MCIIIYRPAEHTLPMDVLEACQMDNSDGWGLMYAQDGSVLVERGMTWAEFNAAYTRLPTDLPMAIHFRWRTHGKTDLHNTHPYEVLSGDYPEDRIWVMHNGIIQIPEYNPDMSDTWHWVRYLAQPILRQNPGALKEKFWVKTLEDTTGYSRLIFMDGKGDVTFLSKSDWYQDYGCRFSNNSFIGSKEINRTSLFDSYYGGRYGAYETNPYGSIGVTNAASTGGGRHTGRGFRYTLNGKPVEDDDYAREWEEALAKSTAEAEAAGETSGRELTVIGHNSKPKDVIYLHRDDYYRMSADQVRQWFDDMEENNTFCLEDLASLVRYDINILVNEYPEMVADFLQELAYQVTG